MILVSGDHGDMHFFWIWSSGLHSYEYGTEGEYMPVCKESQIVFFFILIVKINFLYIYMYTIFLFSQTPEGSPNPAPYTLQRFDTTYFTFG